MSIHELKVRTFNVGTLIYQMFLFKYNEQYNPSFVCYLFFYEEEVFIKHRIKDEEENKMVSKINKKGNHKRKQHPQVHKTLTF